MSFTKKYFMALCLLLLPALTGCQIITQPSLLMKQPRLPAAKSRMLYDVEKAIPEHATLIAPARSTENEKITISYLDDTGKPYVLFFYKTNHHQIHFAVLKEVKKGWHKIFDEQTEADRISRLRIVNAGESGKQDILVSYRNDSENELSVYTMSGRMKLLLQLPVQGVVAGDLIGDHQPDLAVLVPELEQKKTEIIVYQMNAQNQPVMIGNTSINQTTNSHFQTNIGQLNSGKSVLLIGGAFQSKSNEEVFFSNGRLISIPVQRHPVELKKPAFRLGVGTFWIIYV